MAMRRLGLAALALGAALGCKGKGDAAKGPVDLDKRCEQLGKTCADNDKHAEKLTGECKQAAAPQVAKSCTDKVNALYDCYEKELCGKADKVWALDDLRVLADRNAKCASERDAVKACVGP